MFCKHKELNLFQNASEACVELAVSSCSVVCRQENENDKKLETDTFLNETEA